MPDKKKRGQLELFIKGFLSGGRVGGQKGLKKLSGMDPLPSGGRDQTGKDAMSLKTAWGAGSKTNLTEDNQIPEGLFGLIVGRGAPRDTEKSEEVFLLRAGIPNIMIQTIIASGGFIGMKLVGSPNLLP